MRFTAFRMALLVALLLPAGSSRAVTLESRIDGGKWSQAASIYPLKGQRVALRVKPVKRASIRWYRIVPDIVTLYHNAQWPWEPGAYAWLGFEPIRYARIELEAFRGQWTIEPFRSGGIEAGGIVAGEVAGSTPGTPAPPTPSLWTESSATARAAADYSRPDVGTFWFQAELELDGRVLRTPGIESRTEQGLSPKVFRVSIREGDGYLGYVASFYNVPAVFGSTTHQSRNHLGVDCADVLMAAWYRWRGLELKDNFNVQQLTGRFPKVAEVSIVDGVPEKALRWGKDIRPGDLIAVQYEGQRIYQHIGALYADVNRDGVLDRDDLVLHAGPEPLHTSPLRDHGFDGLAIVLRPRGGG